MIKVFEAFAGYGSQSLSLRDCNIEHEVVGISEIEPEAIIAYASLRYDLDKDTSYITDEVMREHLMAKNVGWDFKKQKSRIPRMKKDMLRKLYIADILSHNFGDISILDPTSLPDFDYFTYSFPCQDISVSGKTEGIERGKTRSGLLYECEKIIENKRPKYLLMENVKNLVGKKFKPDFDKWCEYLESLGYTNSWKVLNAKHFGIAQNRERVFMISILGGEKIEFLEGQELTKKLKDFLEKSVDEKYYLSEDVQMRLLPREKTKTENAISELTSSPWDKRYKQSCFVYDVETYAPTVLTGQGGGITPKILELPCIRASRGRNPENPSDRTLGAPTEQRLELNTKGVANTLTSVQKDNYILIPQATKKGYIELETPGVADLTFPNSKTRKGRVQEQGQVTPTLTCRHEICYFETPFRIRKLTPRECFRLMGLSDTDIDRIDSIGLSDSVKYKLAGNSIVKQVLDAIHIKLFK